MRESADTVHPFLLLAAAAHAVSAGAGMRVDDAESLFLLRHVLQQLDQNQVLEDIGMVAGMEGVAVGEHGPLFHPGKTRLRRRSNAFVGKRVKTAWRVGRMHAIATCS
jgi:hypothetical protein